MNLLYIFSECERSPSFKERHPKFRKSSTPDYLLVADHARSIKLNRQSSLSETSKVSEHASSNSQPHTNTLSSVDTARDDKINITLKTQISSSMGKETPYSQVSSSCTFPVAQSVYTSTYEHSKLKRKVLHILVNLKKLNLVLQMLVFKLHLQMGE